MKEAFGELESEGNGGGKRFREEIRDEPRRGALAISGEGGSIKIQQIPRMQSSVGFRVRRVEEGQKCETEAPEIENW